MSNALPRITPRDGLPKTVTVDQFLRLIDAEDDAHKRSRICGLVAVDGDIALLWTHKAVVRALPMPKVNDAAKQRLAKLVPADDVKAICDFLKRYHAGEYEAIRQKAEASHRMQMDQGF